MYHNYIQGEKLKPAKLEDDTEEGKSEDSERDGDSDKEDSKRKRKRADDGTKDDPKTDEKLSTPSGSSTSSQGTNGSTSPDMKRQRLVESPLTSNTEVCYLYIIHSRNCFYHPPDLLYPFLSY